jgi:hypothetical protein
MKDDLARRIIQLERRVQELTVELEAVRSKQRSSPAPGSSLAILRCATAINGRTYTTGTPGYWSVSWGEAVLYDLIIRDSSSPWILKKMAAKSVPLGNLWDEDLPANTFILAHSYNGVYLHSAEECEDTATETGGDT